MRAVVLDGDRLVAQQCDADRSVVGHGAGLGEGVADVAEVVITENRNGAQRRMKAAEQFEQLVSATRVAELIARDSDQVGCGLVE